MQWLKLLTSSAKFEFETTENIKDTSTANVQEKIEPTGDNDMKKRTPTPNWQQRSGG